jgi:hypothetical protein
MEDAAMTTKHKSFWAGLLAGIAALFGYRAATTPNPVPPLVVSTTIPPPTSTTQGTASHGGGSNLGDPGTDGTGGGGAGTQSSTSGTGGSGIVIVRYVKQ